MLAQTTLVCCLLMTSYAARPGDLTEVGDPTVTSRQVDELIASLSTLFEADLRRNAPPSSEGLLKASAGTELFNPFDNDSPLSEDQEPEVSAGFFEGDMVYMPSQTADLRVAVNADRFEPRKWPNGIVPYIISPEYAQSEVTMIKQAINILNTMTCLRFVPRKSTDKDFLIIWPVKKPAGCYAFVGRLGGPQLVSLLPPFGRSKACFVSIGKPIHELLHSVGFFHEQSRSDRDRYVRVIDNNIVQRFKNNFIKLPDINTTTEYTYDYASVMHYGTHFFSSDRRRPTLVPLQNNTAIGQRNGLSVRDCLRVNSYYGCLHRSLLHRLKYLALCRTLGVVEGEY